MAAFDDATPRQQEIITQLSRQLGFGVGDVSEVSYNSNSLPEFIVVETPDRSFVVDARQYYGGIINDSEYSQLLLNRSETRTIPTPETNRPRGGRPDNPRSPTADIPPDDLDGRIPKIPAPGEFSIADPSKGRLFASGLPDGAVTKRSTKDTTVSKFPSAGKDLRVKISDPSRRISQAGGALEPLKQTDYKVVFPFTPEISLSHTANYTPSIPTHSNFEYLFYQHSTVSEIAINGIFVARTPNDADYVLAVQHFFRSVTKMFYGQDDIAGLPPVVCRLEGHGDLQFSYIPIVITGFTVTLPSDVDYISASNPSNGRVPVTQTFNIQAKPIYSRSRITNDFSLTKFSQGALLGNPESGTGGFI
jgi:hypothetical protein